MWPESNELLNRMQSLQIDAVAEDASNGQVGKSLAHRYSVYSAKDKVSNLVLNHVQSNHVSNHVQSK